MDMVAVVGVVEVICLEVPATILSPPSDLTPLLQGESTDVIDLQTELIQVLYDTIQTSINGVGLSYSFDQTVEGSHRRYDAQSHYMAIV